MDSFKTRCEQFVNLKFEKPKFLTKNPEFRNLSLKLAGSEEKDA